MFLKNKTYVQFLYCQLTYMGFRLTKISQNVPFHWTVHFMCVYFMFYEIVYVCVCDIEVYYHKLFHNILSDNV